MATPDQMAEIEEALGDDSGVLFLEPRHFFDDFVIGTGERGNDTFLIYDKTAMIEAMAKSIGENEDEDEDFDPETSALEHFDFNMNQGGDGHPAYASLVCEDEQPQTATLYPLASFSEDPDGNVTITEVTERPFSEDPDGNVTITERRVPGERRQSLADRRTGQGDDLPNLHERRSTYRRKGDWAQYLSRGRS